MNKNKTQSFSSRNLINSLVILLLCLLFTLSCQEKKPTEPEQNQGTRTDTQLIVDKYVLPAGETAEFPSGFEIIANEGVDIQGDILIKPVREGDFTIRCLNGDMILNGKFSVDTTVGTGKTINSGSGLSKTGEIEEGSNLNFVFVSAGHIQLDKKFQAKSGDGESAPDKNITGSELNGDGAYVGAAGGNGGYIHIEAPDGTIFIQKREEGDPPLFVLGNGGKGAKLIVDTETFNTTGSTLNLVGGSGGNSGSLQILAEKIVGLENIPVFSLVDQGYGGDGGDVIWDVSGLMSGNITPDKKYPLREIRFFGGDGGDGASFGGSGGTAIYLSYRVINEVGDPVASVTVIGGGGGNVKAGYRTAAELKPEQIKLPVPIKFVYGGRGGGFIALGNMGWNGVHPDSGESIDGADGGNVLGIGGRGGDVEEGVIFLEEAGGGHGGQPSSEVDRGIFLLSHRILAANGDFTDLLYGVIAGSGGKGAPICEGCPGGNAGNAGTAEAYGGNGGNAPHKIGGKGGSGGDVWTVTSIQLSGASGGDGNEPGKGGCPGSVSFSPGKGGLAYTPGEDGQHLGRQEDTPCSPNGNSCGEGLRKGSDHCGDEYSDSCPEGFVTKELYEINRYETSTVVTIIKKTWHAEIEYPIIDTSKTGHIQRGYRFVSGYYKEYGTNNGEVYREITVELLEYPSKLDAVRTSCDEYGQIIWPDEGILIKKDSNPIEIYMIANGCIYRGARKEDYRCCPYGTGWRISSGECR